MYALLLEKSIALDDPVTLYIPELMHRKEEPWLVNWEQVTLRSLASYLGGLPRDTGSPCFVWREVLEMGYSTSDLAKAGLPTSLGQNNLLENMACTSSDIIDRARTASRIFTVNDRPTYSNAAFSLLGMNSTTTRTPAKNKSIIPLFPNHWGIELGAADATAGFYSTPNDLSRYLRSILRAELLPPSTINAWLKHHSWTDSSTSSAYGLA
ncbi:uncharacterized protein BHQ10_007046 [Talaromyces amestolkiae]|uniref:Beta-lactamase-related domain-containing protein n=1 Tax=Talaromyces amestolkiae TaxID=1196081 RepID=A0A364L5F8_TALAM|nr:uncharacterized protein BHQ10_007046 [Talaromyces amestolkiae]RAO71034.1 hypothetical protein BHQ10_007046 [Talaromyces amestolkiae]